MRILIIAVAALSLASAGAKTPKPAAEPKTPTAAAISHAGDICKATGGFGRLFGRGYGHVDATASEDWAPFEKLTIEPGRITAEAPFRGSHDSEEEDGAAAERFLKVLDHAVEAKHKFAHREAPGGGNVVFHTAKEEGTGLVLELALKGDAVVATCANLGA